MTMSLNIDFPNFNHPEVRAFYEYDLSIPKEKVEQILQLPRETLIEDMETIIMETIQRGDFFKSWEDKDRWWSFHFHALWILVELEAVEALPTLLKLLQQDRDFSWYWWGDYVTEDLWEIYYHLANNKLEELKGILLASGEWVFRIVPSAMAEQIFMHHPERQREIIDWYHAVLDAFLEMENGNEALDPEVICSLVSDLIAMRIDEFLPKIGILYERELIYEGYVGDMKSIETHIKETKYIRPKRPLKQSIYERYEDAMGWHSYQMKYNKEAYEKKPAQRFSSVPPTSISTAEPMVRTSEKTGRNEPCPCGSGKKYKKCCLKK